jgi:hypothetical protein
LGNRLASGVLGLLLASSSAVAQRTGSEFRINTFTTQEQDAPRVAFDSAGRFVVVWQSDTEDGGGYGVYAQRYDASGAPVGPEFRVNTYTSSSQSNASVAVNRATGDFVVVWSGQGQANGLSGVGIFAQRYAAAGPRLGDEFRVNTYTTGGQDRPNVVNGSDGGFLVVWAQNPQSIPDRGIFGQRYDAAGAPAGGEFRLNGYTSHVLDSPIAVVDGNGNVVVVWEDGTNARSYGRRFDASGQPLGPAFLVNLSTDIFEQLPSVAPGASGGFIVVWATNISDTFDPNGGIFGQRFDANEVPLGPVFHVNSFTTNIQSTARVASDSAGNFVVCWTGTDIAGSSSVNVQGQLFRSTGEPIGSEFRANTTTMFAQEVGSVAVTAAGDFVVTWGGDAPGGFDVFGQRYAPIAPHGDADGNGVLDVSDVFYLINALFAGGPPPVGTADANGDGLVDVNDIFYLINYLFAGGPKPK